jgi:hypothetical protein
MGRRFVAILNPDVFHCRFSSSRIPLGMTSRTKRYEKSLAFLLNAISAQPRRVEP